MHRNDPTNALAISVQPGPGVAQDSYNVSIAGATAAFFGDAAGTGIPDIVGSLRVDQAWGSAQIAGALHQLRAGYYGNNTDRCERNLRARREFCSSLLRLTHTAGRRWRGIVINLPWAKGDKFWVEGTVAEGAQGYVGWSGGIVGTVNSYGRFNGNNVAAAWAMDSIFGTLASTGGATGQQLTRYYSIAAAIEHYWTPALRTSVYGSWTAADYNGVATTLFCSSPVGPDSHIRVAPLTVLTGTTARAWLRPGLQRVERRYPHDLESGAAVRYRPGSNVHEGRDEA